MKIVDIQKVITTLIVALIVILLFGAACGLVVSFMGKIFHLNEWTRYWMGGIVSGSLFWLLINGPRGSKRRS
jgi:hypothetical protein